MASPPHLRAALATLKDAGLLLLHDSTLPSLTRLVAGVPVRGTWWAHPSAAAIFACAEALEAHADCAVIKLLSGKLTFVHRRLWPAVLAVGSAGTAWQTAKLDREARALLRVVMRYGLLRLDKLPPGLKMNARAASKLGASLEARLLCHGSQAHTEQGRHARVLQSWPHWRESRGLHAPTLGADEGARLLEGAAVALAGAAKPPLLPWQRTRRH